MNKKSDKLRIYVVGNQKGYACWLDGEIVNKMSDAQLVLFTGGEDINPQIYGENKGSRTGFNKQRDEEEIDEFNKAYSLSLPMFGTCRGAQLLCAMSGGKLVQHLSHSNMYHPIRLWDGTAIDTNSLHHQLMYPFNLPKQEYELLGWAEGLSHIHLNGDDKLINMPTDNQNWAIEPELIYFKKTKCLCIQGHPEMMSEKTKLVKLLRILTESLVSGDLENLISYKMPLDILLQAEKEKDPWEEEDEKFEKILEARAKKTKIEKDSVWD